MKAVPTISQTQKERFLKLADFLETKVHPDNFNMAEILFGDFEEIERGVKEKKPCGSSACALGYAPLAFPGEFDLDSEEQKFFGTVDPFYDPDWMPGGGVMTPTEWANKLRKEIETWTISDDDE